MEEPTFDNGTRPYKPPTKVKRKPVGLILALSFASIFAITAIAFIFASIFFVSYSSFNEVSTEHIYAVDSQVIEIVELEAFYSETGRHAMVMTPELTVITGYSSVNDVRFSVGDVEYLNVNLDGNSPFRISTHNESTIRLYLRGGDRHSYEFLSESRTLNITASDIPVYLFVPDSHFEPVFRDLYIQGGRGPVSIFGGSTGNTFLAESIDISTSGHNSDIHIEDVLVSLFISVHTRNSDIILRNVVGDQNRLNVNADRGNVYVLD